MASLLLLLSHVSVNLAEEARYSTGLSTLRQSASSGHLTVHLCELASVIASLKGHPCREHSALHWHPFLSTLSLAGCLSQYKGAMAVDLPQMQRIRDDFVQQMHAGLAAEGGSSLPMIPTHVDILPDGCGSSELMHNRCTCKPNA